ncbi:MAG: AAA family ATPase, partial [Candidatus Babeliales bacterium]
MNKKSRILFLSLLCVWSTSVIMTASSAEQTVKQQSTQQEEQGKLVHDTLTSIVSALADTLNFYIEQVKFLPESSFDTKEQEALTHHLNAQQALAGALDKNNFTSPYAIQIHLVFIFETMTFLNRLYELRLAVIEQNSASIKKIKSELMEAQQPLSYEVLEKKLSTQPVIPLEVIAPTITKIEEQIINDIARFTKPDAELSIAATKASILEQLLQTKNILGHLFLLVENTYKKEGDQAKKETMRREIGQFIKNVDLLCIESSNIETLAAAEAFSLNCDILYKAIYKSITTSFKSIPDYTLSPFSIHGVTIDYKEEITPEKIQQALQAKVKSSPLSLDTENAYEINQLLKKTIASNIKLLESFNSAMKSVGLSWYNKAYRVFNSWIIEPATKYPALHPALLSASVLSSLYLWHVFVNSTGIIAQPAETGTNPGTEIKDFPTAWKWVNDNNNKLPQKPFNNNSIDTFVSLDRNFSKHGFMAGLEKNLRLLGLGTAIGAYLLWPIYEPTFKAFFGAWGNKVLDCITRIKTSLKKKLFNTHTFLLGGAHQDRKLVHKWTFDSCVTLDDVIGLEEAKDIIKDIIHYFKNPEGFDQTKNKISLHTLFAGPPRTGKSLIASSIVSEIKKVLAAEGKNPDSFQFVSVPVIDILREGGIKNVKQQVLDLAPCVLFIDEIDLLGLQRENNPLLLAEFLEVMSDYNAATFDKKVVILAATNNPHNLDKALLSPGRFGRTIYFDYPLYEDRKECITRELKKTVGETSLGEFDIERFARETGTENCSFEDIKQTINYMSFTAMKRNVPMNNQLLFESFNKTFRKINALPLDIAPDKLAIIATHQAGIALTRILLQTRTKPALVTICPWNPQIKEVSTFKSIQDKSKSAARIKDAVQFGANFTYTTGKNVGFYSIDEARKELKVLIAGHMAQKVLFGDASFQYDVNSLKKAFKCAQNIVSNGLQVQDFSQDLQAEYERKALDLIEKTRKEVYEQLTKHKETLGIISQSLLQQQSLNESDLMEIVN